jgi:hypothetical protein
MSMFYNVIVGYEQDTVDKEGNPKVKKVKYLCEAECLEEASLVMAQFAAESMGSAKVMSITEDKTSEVITQQHSPKYYNKKQLGHGQKNPV